MAANRYVFGFCLMLTLSTIFIVLFGAFKPSPISSRVQKEKFWADKVHSKKQYHMVIAGDSRVYRGVDPGTLSAKTGGLSVLNFGFSSGGFNDLIFSEIDSRLLEGVSPKVVVLGITPYSVTPKAQENSHLLQEKMRNPKDVFYRRYINPFLGFFEPIIPTDLFRDADTIQGYHETFREDGWVASYKLPSDPQAALQPYKRNFQDNYIEKEILKDLYRQIEKWRSIGVKVFAFRVPSTDDMEALENTISGFNEREVRKGIEAAGGNWLEIENRYGYESYDGSHLTEKAAVTFSAYLGRLISENLRSLN